MDNHIILLRFNQIINSQLSPNEMYEGNPSWLDHRFNLFESSTLKCLEGQTDKDFWVFLLTDPNTPKNYEKKIKE